MLVAIDPGTTHSGVVVLTLQGTVIRAEKAENSKVLSLITAYSPEALAIEMICSYGMAVGQGTFNTCVWIGRFLERFGVGASKEGKDFELIPRKEVCKNICNDGRAKDANIRQALIDRYGGSKRKAIGLKKSPGPLYGFKSDIWSALAIGLTYLDRRKKNVPIAGKYDCSELQIVGK